MGPDDQVVDAVAVDVARARDRTAAAVVRVDPVEAEAVDAVERREIEARREAGVGAEDDVALAGTPVAGSAGRPDDQVVDAVAVDVARAGDREAAAVVRVDPVEAEAVRPVERREIEARREAGVRAEDDIALAGGIAVRIGARGPDDQVVDAVAVDVARPGDREAAAVVRVDPVEAEAVRPVEVRQRNRISG